MTAEPQPGWISIARILRPQGRRGEVLADLLTDLDPSVQFASGRVVQLGSTASSRAASKSATVSTSATIEGFWLPVGKNAGRIVLKLSSCETISAAEMLAGQDLLVPASDLPTLDPDTFYVNDLLGCVVFDRDQAAGTVVDVQFATTADGKTRLPDAAPLLCLHLDGQPDNAEPVLVPFARAYLISVEVKEKRIVMHLPEKLLDPKP